MVQGIQILHGTQQALLIAEVKTIRHMPKEVDFYKAFDIHSNNERCLNCSRIIK